MKIVIIGDGKVGYMLAKKLSEEDYDIVLNNPEGAVQPFPLSEQHYVSLQKIP